MGGRIRSLILIYAPAEILIWREIFAIFPTGRVYETGVAEINSWAPGPGQIAGPLKRARKSTSAVNLQFLIVYIGLGVCDRVRNFIRQIILMCNFFMGDTVIAVFHLTA